jgi:hypothetical protein
MDACHRGRDADLCRVPAGGRDRSSGQAVPDQPQMAENVFKNVQVLKGIPVDEFMDAMGMFASSLGYDCASCHDQGIHTDRAAFAVTTPTITRARADGGDDEHHQQEFFKAAAASPVSPAIVELQAREHSRAWRCSTPLLTDDPNAMTIFSGSRRTVDQVFAKYMQALGGADRVAR